ncbi:MAG: hypothetical protein ACM34K_21790 [Bacillota bacterium]
MIKNKIKLCLLIVLLVIPVSLISGQITFELEKRLVQLQDNLEKQSRELELLKQTMNIKAEQIDAEKKRNSPDRNKIADLMSHSVSISNKIDFQQKKLSVTEIEIESVKKLLNRRYASAIDSLNQLKTARKGNQEEIQSQILLLTEKKLITAPKISMLTLNPDKLLKMDVKQAKSEREESLYREYIQSALNEIDTQLKKVNESYREAEEIVYLQKKAGKFLEEAEFQSEIRPGRRSASRSYSGENSYASPLDLSKDGARSANLPFYTGILTQLQAVTSPYIKSQWLSSAEGKDKHLSMDEYYELLKEVKKNLQEYRTLLLHKLDKK